MTNSQKKRLIWQVPFLMLLIVGTVLIIRQQHNMPYQKCAGSIFGTIYHITYQHEEDLEAELVAKMQEVDSALSMFNEKSIISNINRNEKNEPNEMFINVFQLAQQVSEDTYGAFDITVAPLVNAWGFGFRNSEMPTQHAVDSLRAIVGYKKVRFDGKHVVKDDPRITLDCSGIAKGYAVDVVAQLLDKKGVTKPTNDPEQEDNELQAIINVTDKCMATSGNYRNFYYKNGKRYAHTIDPKTGYPVQHNILSATVLSSKCARADAYATAFMVMGFDSAQKVLERNPDLMAYLIYDEKGENRVWYSSALKDKIQK